MRDLTQGNEIKLIFYFSLPMLIGNIFQQLYNTVDSIIVGKFIGKDALAAVGASFPIIFLLVSLVMGISMGFTVLIAQYYGAKELGNVKKTIHTGFIFLFIASLSLTVIGLLVSGPILRLLKTPSEIFVSARNYLNIIFLGMLVMFGYNSLSAILRGLGDSKTPLYFLIISTIANIILDLLFVIVFRWGVEGAAWATVIAQGVSFVLAFLYLNRSHELFRLDLKKLTFDREIFFLSFKIGLPSGIQQMLVATGAMALTRIVNSFGTDTIAAFTAAGRIDSFASMPAMNLSAALSAFVGQNLGAEKPERVKKGYLAALFISLLFSLTTTAVVFLFGPALIGLFNSDPGVITIGAQYLRIVGVFYIIFSTMFVTNGALRGAGRTIIPMFSTVLSLWLIRVPVSSYLASRIGTDGIWWGVPAGWTMGALLSLGYFSTGKWKQRITAQKKITVDRGN